MGLRRSGDEPDDEQAKGHAHQAKKANLAVLQLQDLGEDMAPATRRDQGKQALKDENQAHGHPPGVGHGASQDQRAAAAPLLRMDLKKSDEGSTTMTSPLPLNVAL